MAAGEVQTANVDNCQANCLGQVCMMAAGYNW